VKIGTIATGEAGIMNSTLKIITPGAHTTIQDFGRFGFQEIGVPVSGALDSESLRLANKLVGNRSGEAGMEILHLGPSMEVATDSIRIALGGIGAKIEVEDNDVPTLDPWQSAVLYRGQKFRVQMDNGASCCYLAIEGGFDLQPCMGSLSTYTRAGLGGYGGRALLSGDELPLVRAVAADRNEVRMPFAPEYLPDAPVRITWGVQRQNFTEESQSRFISEPYTIQPESDRMGYRVAGPELECIDTHDIISDGIATGAIQVPGNGQPIVLLADHQTTGGYAKIATVISTDIPLLGRLRPGQEIRFSVVDIAEAERIRGSRETALQSFEDSMSVVTDETTIDLHVLYHSNLISGIQ
jgi:biotin-dependent carboxylase-like uncharacterized protein